MPNAVPSQKCRPPASTSSERGKDHDDFPVPIVSQAGGHRPRPLAGNEPRRLRRHGHQHARWKASTSRSCERVELLAGSSTSWLRRLVRFRNSAALSDWFEAMDLRYGDRLSRSTIRCPAIRTRNAVEAVACHALWHAEVGEMRPATTGLCQRRDRPRGCHPLPPHRCAAAPIGRRQIGCQPATPPAPIMVARSTATLPRWSPIRMHLIKGRKRQRRHGGDELEQGHRRPIASSAQPAPAA